MAKIFGLKSKCLPFNTDRNIFLFCSQRHDRSPFKRSKGGGGSRLTRMPVPSADYGPQWQPHRLRSASAAPVPVAPRPSRGSRAPAQPPVPRGIPALTPPRRGGGGARPPPEAAREGPAALPPGWGATVTSAPTRARSPLSGPLSSPPRLGGSCPAPPPRLRRQPDWAGLRTREAISRKRRATGSAEGQKGGGRRVCCAAGRHGGRCAGDLRAGVPGGCWGRLKGGWWVSASPL